MELPLIIERILGSVWRASWQASVLVALILVAQWLCRHRLAPKWRYALWLLVVFRLMLPVTPPSAWSLFNYGPCEPFSGAQLARWAGSEEETMVFVRPVDAPAEPRAEPSPKEARLSQAVTSLSDQRPAPKTPVTIRTTLLVLRENLGWIWLVGVLVLGMRLAWGNYLFSLQLRRRHPIEDPAVLALFGECRQTMGVRRSLTLLEAPELDGPALFGCFRLKMLLPEKMVSVFSPSELRHVFLHELAHIRRWDTAVNWLTTILQSIHWFNPALWFAFHRMRADRELACDELTLARANEAESKPYGRTVIKVLEGFTGPTAIPGLVGILEDKKQIKRRIHMIAQFKKTASWPVMGVALVIALALVSLTDAQIRRGAENLGGQSANQRATSADSTTTKTGSPNDQQPSPAKAASIMTMRRLDLPPRFLEYGEPCISRDGRYIVQLSGGPIVLELSTGTIREVRDVRDPWTIMYPKFSPDAKRVVAGGRSTNQPPNVNELVMVDLETKESRRVFRQERIANLMPMDWSADGRNVLFIYMELGPSHKWHIATFSVNDGSVREVKSPERWSLSSSAMAFSPDGQWIVYDMPQSSNTSGPRDVFLLAADGSREVPLVQHPSDDYVLGWAPVGNWILFGSNRRGTWDAYAIQVADGEVARNPELVKEGMGRPRPFGFTREGTFVYRVGTESSDVYLATLDPVSGNVQDEPKKMPHRFEGYSGYPSWSRDGRYLAFLSTHGHASPDGSIYIRDLVTGTERPFEVTQGPVNYPRWSSDGRFLHAMVREQERTRGIQIDTRTGASGVVLTNGNFNQVVGWTPDGRSFFYKNFWGEAVVRREIETGAETRIPLNTRQATTVSLSPDGKHLAFFEDYFWIPATRTNQTTIFIMPAAGGEKRKLVDKQRVGHFGLGLAWSNDSRYVFFSKGRTGPATLCRVPVDGVEVEALGPLPGEPDDLCLSPDGRTVAFTVRSRKREVWVLENFLPATASAHRQ